MPLPKTKHHRSLALICLACTAAVWWLANYFGPYAVRELNWRDTVLQRWGRKAAKHPDLLFLGIDNSVESASDLDLATSPELQAMRAGFPWPRWVYGAIAERLVEAGAKVVAFDVLLTAEKEGDNALQARFEKYAEHVVIGSNLALVEQKDGATVTMIPRQIPPSPSVLPAGERGRNLFGYVNFRPDWDGIVRRANYRTTVLEYFGKPPVAGQPELLSLAAQTAVKAGYGAHLPATREPVMFRFPLIEGIRARSVHQIFVERLWASPTFQSGAVFRDKIVFVGPFGNWVKDELATPFGNTLGTVIHLSALNAALQNEYLGVPEYLHETTPAANTALLLGGGLLALLLGAFVAHPLLRVGLLLSAGAGYVALAYAGCQHTGW